MREATLQEFWQIYSVVKFYIIISPSQYKKIKAKGLRLLPCLEEKKVFGFFFPVFLIYRFSESAT